MSPDGFIEVDFLTGNTVGRVSPSLVKAVNLYVRALAQLCESQGVLLSDFERLSTKYVAKSDHHFIVEVTDRRGKTSRDLYFGLASERPRPSMASGG